MSTVIRNSISKNNKYYISKHRFLELKHFCLQYPEWKKEYNELSFILSRSVQKVSNNRFTDPTYEAVYRRSIYFEKMRLVESCAMAADPDLYEYILKAVTEERSYVYLQTMYEIPCSRDMYYDRYRKFFYILSSRK